MILDKLIEKKDISTYIAARKRRLEADLSNIEQFPKEKRQYIKQKIMCRIEELITLRRLLVSNNKNRTIPRPKGRGF